MLQVNDNTIPVVASELTRKRRNKIFYRLKPSDCPLKEKYCYKSCREIDPNQNKDTFKEEFNCPFLKSKGVGNEDGYLVIACSCKENSVKFIMLPD